MSSRIQGFVLRTACRLLINSQQSLPSEVRHCRLDYCATTVQTRNLACSSTLAGMFSLESLLAILVADLVFSPVGAMCGFIAFQTCTGNLIARNIYKAFAENDDFAFPGASARTAGIAWSLNYLAQLAIAVLGGGYATGTAEAITHSMVPSASILHK